MEIRQGRKFKVTIDYLKKSY